MTMVEPSGGGDLAPRPDVVQVNGQYVSADGRWVWTGQAWVAAPPHLSADGMSLWNGATWVQSPRRRRQGILSALAALAAGFAALMVPAAAMTAAGSPPGERDGGDPVLTVVQVAIVNLPAVLLGLAAAVSGLRRAPVRQNGPVVIGLVMLCVGLVCAALDLGLFFS